FAQVSDLRLELLCAVNHRAELVDLKRAAILADALLAEEDRARRVEANEQRDDWQDGEKDWQRRQAERHVYGALGEVRARGETVRAGADQRDAVEHLDIDVVHAPLEHVGDEAAADAGLFADVHHAHNLLVVLPGQGDDHLVDALLREHGIESVNPAQTLDAAQAVLLEGVV